MSGQRLGGIGHGEMLLLLAVFGVGEYGGSSFRRTRTVRGENVHQLLYAHRLTRRREADRNQMPFAHGLLERLVQLIGADFALIEVLFHQRFVNFDHLLDDGGMVTGDIPEVA